MIFNSIDFAIFFPTVFFLYWLVFNKKVKVRNIYLIAVSYLFYGWWDWRFLSLIIISSFIDFFTGKRIFNEGNPKKRTSYLILSLLVNLGFLGFFKYCNFFIDSFINAFSLFGVNFSAPTLNIILPVGISFYTFQTLSYTIDIYQRKMEPTDDIFEFFAFVSFFPQLVAGPIERAKHLLPQFKEKTQINYQDLRSGLLLVAWGLFKKIVIADRLARFVNAAYADTGHINGLPAIFATVFFAFQLYFDFSAYSDIAIGTARTLGFKLSLNFNRPYLSSSFADFWKRWHISLSSWFKDYVYIPLGGNRKGNWLTKRNVMVVFLLSGLWHGASWNFVIWGGLNGLFIILLDKILFKLASKGIQRFLTSLFVSSCWAISLIFFRAQSFSGAIEMYKSLGFSNKADLFNYGFSKSEFSFTIYLLIFMIIFEIIQERKINLLEWFYSLNRIVRWSIYIGLSLSILYLGSYGIGLNDSNFIYFQF